VPASADLVTGLPDQFLSSFTGPHNGDLDILSANVTLNGSDFDFTATLDGTVGTTTGAVYVFGLDRGDGSAKFSNIGESGVIFDSVFVIANTGGGTVKDLINKTSTPISDVTISGATISGVVPVSDFPTEGFSPNNYTFNLWPEAGPPNPGNTEISDFAPNNSMSPVSVTPEPASMSLFMFGVTVVAAVALIRRRKAAQ
jgi:hypothetical protein